MIIASAQIRPFSHNIERNIDTHISFVKQAAEVGADFIIFPEMSLTGYLREKGIEFCFMPLDSRLEPLKALSVAYKITIVVGAPILMNNELYIGSFVLSPNRVESIYTKQYLHAGEELFYSSSFNYNPLVEVNNDNVALAICADIKQAEHPKAACNNNATIYGASIFYTAGGIAGGLAKLGMYAKHYNMPVIMSDFVGVSYGFEAGGKSSFWDNSGNLIGQLSAEEEGLLVVEKSAKHWRLLNS